MYYTDNSEIFLKGNSTGILMIHGMGCTPSEMKGLADHLHEIGYTVLAIRLPGHGTKFEDMEKVTSDDWVSYAKSKLDFLKEHCDKVVVFGRSLGSLVTLKLVTEHGVDGVILMSPPMFNDHLLTPLFKIVRVFKKTFTIQKDCKEEFYLKTKNPAPFTVYYYPKVYVSTLINVFKLIKYFRVNKHKYPDLPTLIIQGVNDPLIPKGSSKKLYAMLPAQNKESIFFQNSCHSPHVEIEREKVWKTMSTFIGKI